MRVADFTSFLFSRCLNERMKDEEKRDEEKRDEEEEMKKKKKKKEEMEEEKEMKQIYNEISSLKRTESFETRFSLVFVVDHKM